MRSSWLSKNLLLLTLISLTQDAASELLYPLLPILVTTIIGASPVALGLIEGIAEAAAGFTKLWSGKMSDRYGRKSFVSIGYTLAGVGKLFVSLSSTWGIYLLGRVTDRIGKGIRAAPRDGLIVDSVAKEDLGKAFGFHRAGDNLGAVIGPVLALVGLWLLDDDVRKVALWSIIPASLSALLTFFIIDTRKRSARVTRVKDKKKLSPEIKKVISVLVIIQLFNIPDLLLLLRLSDIGFTITEVVLAYILFNTVNTFAAFPAGKFADKVDPRFVYGVGLVAFASAYIILGSTTSHLWAVFALIIYGAYPALTDGVGKAWIAKLSDEDMRGSAQGTFQSSMNFALLAAGAWGGYFWSHGKNEVPLIVAGVGAGLAAILLLSNFKNLAKYLKST